MLGEAGEPAPDAPCTAGSTLLTAAATAAVWFVGAGTLGGCGLVMTVAAGGGGVAFRWLGFM